MVWPTRRDQPAAENINHHPIMQHSNNTRAAGARLACLLLTFAAAPEGEAALTGTRTPAFVAWTQVADTATPALDSAGLSLGINYAGFDPPVISQWSTSIAFKGRLAAPAIPGDDEGVWRTQGTFGTPWLALREGDPYPGSGTRTFGFSGSLDVRNLQCGANDWLACATNTSVAGGKVGIGYNLTLHNLGESPTAAWSDLRPPVITNMGSPFATDGQIGMWRRETPGSARSGVAYFKAPLPSSPPSFSHWATGFGGGWKINQPPRVGSPSISDGGFVAAYAHDFGTPQAHIHLIDPFGIPSAVIVRQGDPTLTAIPGFIPAGSKFGIIHNQLMANSDAITSGLELVAWQMQTMASPVVNKTSLWCKQGTFRHCLAFQGQSAPDLPPANLITSFYELQAVPDYTTADTHWVFWGANLTGGKAAIYRTRVGLGFASPPDLIATDVPFTAWVGLISGGLHAITTLDKFFSVNVHGALLFSASCSTAPAGQRRILVTATVLDNHDRQVRAQSGISVLGGGRIARFFDLAKPEQGQCGRGQAVGTQWFTARITFGIGQEGIFWATL